MVVYYFKALGSCDEVGISRYRLTMPSLSLVSIGSSREKLLELNLSIRPGSTMGGTLLKLKRGRSALSSFGRWNKRWLNIEGHYLRWYSNIHATQPSGSIDLRHIRALAECRLARVAGASSSAQGELDMIIDDEIMNEDNTFAIDTRDRMLILKAASRQEMAMWLHQLQSLSDRAKGGDGNSIVGWQVGRANAAATGNWPQALSSRGAIVPASPTATKTEVTLGLGGGSPRWYILVE